MEKKNNAKNKFENKMIKKNMLFRKTKNYLKILYVYLKSPPGFPSLSPSKGIPFSFIINLDPVSLSSRVIVISAPDSPIGYPQKDGTSAFWNLHL